MPVMQAGEYLVLAADSKPTAARTLKRPPGDAPWWSGVVVDSVLGFSATLVFVLAGVLFLRKRFSQRGQSRYDPKQPRKQTS